MPRSVPPTHVETVSQLGQWLFDAMRRTVEAAEPGRLPVLLVRREGEADLIVLRRRDYGALNNPFADSPRPGAEEGSAGNGKGAGNGL